MHLYTLYVVNDLYKVYKHIFYEKKIMWDCETLYVDFFDGLFYLGESSLLSSIDVGVSLALAASQRNPNFDNQYEDDCRLT